MKNKQFKKNSKGVMATLISEVLGEYRYEKRRKERMTQNMAFGFVFSVLAAFVAGAVIMIAISGSPSYPHDTTGNILIESTPTPTPKPRIKTKTKKPKPTPTPDEFDKNGFIKNYNER